MPRFAVALATLLCLSPFPRAHGQSDTMAMGAMAMSGNLGNYPMARESSGTSWQPDSAPNEALMTMTAHGMRMWQGNIAGVYTDQSGPRGDQQAFNTSMLMFMANRSFGSDTAAFRAMASASNFCTEHHRDLRKILFKNYFLSHCYATAQSTAAGHDQQNGGC